MGLLGLVKLVDAVLASVFLLTLSLLHSQAPPWAHLAAKAAQAGAGGLLLFWASSSPPPQWPLWLVLALLLAGIGVMVGGVVILFAQAPVMQQACETQFGANPSVNCAALIRVTLASFVLTPVIAFIYSCCVLCCVGGALYRLRHLDSQSASLLGDDENAEMDALGVELGADSRNPERMSMAEKEENHKELVERLVERKSERPAAPKANPDELLRQSRARQEEPDEEKAKEGGGDDRPEGEDGKQPEKTRPEL